jgi:hypothetical protein
MPLAFSASQELQLAVSDQPDRLASYLTQTDRVVRALFDPSQLKALEPGHYRYSVTHLQVFKLEIHPVVTLRTSLAAGKLLLESSECELEGLGLVEDFRLGLCSWLAAADGGLTGEASLSVTVSRPTLLKVIPPKVLEATGRSVLGGILLGIRTRVSQQLLGDFQSWCRSS